MSLNGCLIKNTYKDLISVYQTGSSLFVTRAEGHSYCKAIKINGTLTGSIICSDTLLINKQDAVSCIINPKFSGASCGSITSYGCIKLEERATNPSAPPIGTGSFAFVNNELWVYSDL